MKDVVDRVIGLIKMFGDKSRIREVFIVENGAAMLPMLVEMALGLPNVFQYIGETKLNAKIAAVP